MKYDEKNKSRQTVEVIKAFVYKLHIQKFKALIKTTTAILNQ